MPSASPHIIRLALLAVCASLLLGAGAGCSTTQEKAEVQAAKAEHILNARAEREKAKKRHKPARKHQHSRADGPKTGHIGRKSAHRQGGGGEG